MQRSYYVFLEEVVRGLCPYLKRELAVPRVPMMIKVTFSTLKRRECGTYCYKICLSKKLWRVAMVVWKFSFVHCTCVIIIILVLVEGSFKYGVKTHIVKC